MQFLVSHCIPVTRRILLMSMYLRPTEKNKLVKTNTLKNKKYLLKYFKFNFSKLVFFANKRFTYLKCLHFLYSSI